MTATGGLPYRRGVVPVACVLWFLTLLARRVEAEALPVQTPWRAEASVAGVLVEPLFTPEPHLDPAYGIGFGFGVGRRPVPLTLGLDFAATRGSGAESSTPITLGDTTATLIETRTRQTVFVDLWLRLAPSAGSWRPYVEASGGLAMLNYVYSLRFPDAVHGTAVFGQRSSAATFGLGLGLEFVVARARSDPEAVLCVAFGLRHLWGSRASSEPRTATAVDLHTSATLLTLGFTAHTQFGPTASDTH